MTTVVDALTAAGIVVYDARVDPRPGGWVPTGVLWHHVGNSPPRALQTPPPPSLRLVQEGRADLAGPLCQWLVDGAGDWWWITDGRANHAGAGDIDVWHWLIADPTKRLPDPPRPNDNADTNDGNGHMVGIEVEGNGNWSATVHHSMMVGTRALLDFYGRPKDNVIGHKEWTTRKTDPAGVSMPEARAALRLPLPPPLPIPPTIKDNTMYLINPTSDDAQGGPWYILLPNQTKEQGALFPLRVPELEGFKAGGVPILNLDAPSFYVLEQTLGIAHRD